MMHYVTLPVSRFMSLYIVASLTLAMGNACLASQQKASTPAKKLAPSNASKQATPNSTKNEITQWCQRFSARLPGLKMSDCVKVSLVSSGAKSRNGSPILIRRYAPSSKLKEAGSKPPIRILLLGGIHGDELTASAIVFEWMQSIQTGAAQSFRWEVVPVLNPDGMFAPRPTRLNARGIDLNRNFPTPNWATEAPRYWKTQTGNDPRRFPGKAPLSEPETKWVNDEMVRFRPHVIISVHAPFGILDFDGPSAPPQRFGRLVLNPLGVYPGSLGNYSGKFKNVPVITIELPNALAMPTNAETQRIWLDMLDWITRNVQQQLPLPT